MCIWSYECSRSSLQFALPARRHLRGSRHLLMSLWLRRAQMWNQWVLINHVCLDFMRLWMLNTISCTPSGHRWYCMCFGFIYSGVQPSLSKRREVRITGWVRMSGRVDGTIVWDRWVCVVGSQWDQSLLTKSIICVCAASWWHLADVEPLSVHFSFRLRENTSYYFSLMITTSHPPVRINYYQLCREPQSNKCSFYSHK